MARSSQRALYALILFFCPALPPAAFPAHEAFAEEINCIQCHEELAKDKVHPAVSMGCASCHAAIDASDIPHKIKNKIAKGLSSDQPELCYGCHEKGIFTKKNVHAAVGMGCTGCHNPHSSKNQKLLKSEQPDICYNCHDKALFTQQIVHAALGMGCTSCHSPHSSKERKLLASDQPELCYGCHDKGAFTRKTVHAAVGMGCTGCHSPHSSKNQKLLGSPTPDLCYNCHDKAEFGRKNVHAPVAGGMCLKCHAPHSTDTMLLLIKEPLLLCLDCHADVEKKLHVVRGPAGAGHPIGKKAVKDPKRPERDFYCGSCHNPHSSDSIGLFRYAAKTKMGTCVNCHTFR